MQSRRQGFSVGYLLRGSSAGRTGKGVREAEWRSRCGRQRVMSRHSLEMSWP